MNDNSIQQGSSEHSAPPTDEAPTQPALVYDDPLEGEMDDVEANNSVSTEHPSN